VNHVTVGRLALISLLIMTAAITLAAPAAITLPADPPATRSVELVEQWRIGGEDDEDILLGVIFLDETVAPIALLGAALVIAGAWVASRAESD
jgi:drug/metabolite transporter (DMT)-like permease